MNITINATILFQAFNFWIAYFIFRVVLLRPAYAAIVADNERKSTLESLVAQDKKRIEDTQKEIAAQWQSSYLFFKQQAPAQISLGSRQQASKALTSITFDEQQLLTMRRTLCDAIVCAIGAEYESC